jgi:hypothetical protein
LDIKNQFASEATSSPCIILDVLREFLLRPATAWIARVLTISRLPQRPQHLKHPSHCEAVVRGLNQLAETGSESDGEIVRKIEVEIYQEPTRHTLDVPKLLKWIKNEGERKPGGTNEE